MSTPKKINVCFRENANTKQRTNGFTRQAVMTTNALNFTPLFNDEEDNAVFAIYNNKSDAEKKLQRIYSAEVNAEDVERIMNDLAEDPDVEFAEVNDLFETKYIPNDPLYSQLYGLEKIECDAVWPNTTGEGIVVAVIDTGVDYNHPDIRDNMWTKNGEFGYDFSNDTDDPQDPYGHGTHVAGTIAAAMNNSIGIVGVAPDCKIMAVKIFPNAYPDVITKALKYAVDNGAKILNNSWGPSQRRPSSPTIEAAIDYVYSKGGICVFAAGNEGDDVVHYSPANYHKTITVGATDENDNITAFSNHGEEVTVDAPGNNILSLENNTTQYTSKNGTSMAAPHVSGALALHLSLYPDKSFEELEFELKTTSDNGRLNCRKLTNNAT